MIIRQYQPGDEVAQVRIYNEAASSLAGFKPATVEEVARRYRTADPDPAARLFAVEEERPLGYGVFNPNGRISYPWCLAPAEAFRGPLLDALLAAMRDRGHRRAWAAYRGDWEPVLSFFRQQGFQEARGLINYVAELSDLPHPQVPAGQSIRPLRRVDIARLLTLAGPLFDGIDAVELEHYFWENPYFDPSSLYALTPDSAPDQLLGVGLLIANADYADPAKIDAAMPCFRLGAFGTELQRHKRVNGLFSCLFRDVAHGEAILAEALRRGEAAGLTRLAAQAPSDQGSLVAFYDHYFRRQGSFPILERALDSP